METAEQATTTDFSMMKDHVTDYVKTRIELVKLTAVDKGSEAISNAAAYAIVGIVGMFFLVFISFAGAFALSAALDSYSLGFLCIAVFYLLVGGVLFAMRETWIKLPLINSIIKSILK